MGSGGKKEGHNNNNNNNNNNNRDTTNQDSTDHHHRHHHNTTMGVSRSEVRITSFVPSIAVITSKQRPRKILIKGSEGNEHTFLLKGHEDLRQDERVMQLFGLTNALLANHRDTSKRDLSIRRYAVIPLSPNCGIIGWGKKKVEGRWQEGGRKVEGRWKKMDPTHSLETLLKHSHQ